MFMGIYRWWGLVFWVSVSALTWLIGCEESLPACASCPQRFCSEQVEVKERKSIYIAPF